MTRAGVAVLVLGLVASCAARTVVSEFRCELSAPASLPRENAEFLARLAGMSSVSVARALRLPELDHFRVKVAPDRHLAGGTHGGARLDAVPTILLGGVCLDDHALFVRIVWHELAHIYLLELDAGLPDMLQEGIAEYMGTSSQPPEQAQFELEHRIEVPPWPELLKLTFAQFSRMPTDARLRVRRASLELVLRIGFEELVGMLHDRELLERSLEAALDPASRPTGGARQEIGEHIDGAQTRRATVVAENREEVVLAPSQQWAGSSAGDAASGP